MMVSDSPVDELVLKVREMRIAQRSYFRSRSPGSLKLAKRLEGEVDALLELIESERSGLFSEFADE